MRALDLRRICNVRVRHCREAYGVLVESFHFRSEASFPHRADGAKHPWHFLPGCSTAEAVEWRLLYSGDCRPSDDLVRLGKDTQQQLTSPTKLLRDTAADAATSDHLIHEATFEDEMAEDAVAEALCRMEAIDVGRRMDAHRIILTRKTALPDHSKPAGAPVLPSVVAFDVVGAVQSTPQAPASVPVLRCLFPPEIDEDREISSSPKKIMAYYAHGRVVEAYPPPRAVHLYVYLICGQQLVFTIGFPKRPTVVYSVLV